MKAPRHSPPTSEEKPFPIDVLVLHEFEAILETPPKGKPHQQEAGVDYLRVVLHDVDEYVSPTP